MKTAIVVLLAVLLPLIGCIIAEQCVGPLIYPSPTLSECESALPPSKPSYSIPYQIEERKIAAINECNKRRVEIGYKRNALCSWGVAVGGILAVWLVVWYYMTSRNHSKGRSSDAMRNCPETGMAKSVWSPLD